MNDDLNFLEATASEGFYPYPQDVGGLNWAWVATTLGAAMGVLALEAVPVEQTRGKTLAALVIGGWLGAKWIRPA